MILLFLLGLLQVEPRDRCVLLSAEVKKLPPQIELRWTADPKASGYSVFRKAPTDAGWVEAGSPLEGTATRYADTSVQVGVAYEYKVLKSGQAGDKTFKGTGYLQAGIEIPLRDSRGKVVLVVDAAHAEPLAEPLGRLERDLAGDGWVVVRRDVPPTATPPEVKSRIKEI